MTDNNKSLKKQTVTGLIWSFMERASNQVVSFIVSIILARLLLPSDYGVIAIVMVFINLCDVFVVGGMGTALVQKKNVDDYDYCSVFYINTGLSFIIYSLLFFSAPSIADFYNMPQLAPLLRFLGLRMFFATFDTIQRATVSRQMKFKNFFWATSIGTVISAIIGIAMAYHGYGIWALVAQNLSNNFINIVVLFIFVRWWPKLLFSWERAKVLFSFGWKQLASNLIDALYEDFRSLYVGKLYAPAELAYYTRGKQFPYLVVNNINSSISAVLFPALSKKQDSPEELKRMTRRAIKTSSFVLMPIMFFLASIAEPLVIVLLTEKWLPCVPFIQILCFNCALMPIQTANIQAILALGRSDISLRTSIIKKSIGFVIILITASYSVLAMAYGGILIAIIASIVNSAPNAKLLRYGYLEQIKDIIPFVTLSALMSIPVCMLSLLPIGNLYILLLQCIAAPVIYIFLCTVFRVESFKFVLENIKSYKNR